MPSRRMVLGSSAAAPPRLRNPLGHLDRSTAPPCRAAVDASTSAAPLPVPAVA